VGRERGEGGGGQGEGMEVPLTLLSSYFVDGPPRSPSRPPPPWPSPSATFAPTLSRCAVAPTVAPEGWGHRSDRNLAFLFSSVL